MTGAIFSVSRIDVQQWCNTLKLTFNIKFTTHCPPPAKKSQFSQKSTTPPPPSKKINLPNLNDLIKTIHVLRALYNISFVWEIKKKNLQN